MTEEQLLKMDLLKACSGNVTAAQIAYDWLKPSSAPIAASEKEVLGAKPDIRRMPRMPKTSAFR